MNQVERKNVGAAWIALADVYGKQISPVALKTMLDAIDDLPADMVLIALQNWPRISRMSRHPFPIEVRDAIAPRPDSRTAAVEIARKIDLAIGRHGWTWENGFFEVQPNGEAGRYWEGGGKRHSSFRHAVIAEVGEIGWHAIQSRGGWLSVRDSANTMEEGQFIAQLRDQVEASMSLAAKGIDITKLEMVPPKLPATVHSLLDRIPKIKNME